MEYQGAAGLDSVRHMTVAEAFSTLISTGSWRNHI